jgi:endo-1,4-beta-D-glucanase Y
VSAKSIFLCGLFVAITACSSDDEKGTGDGAGGVGAGTGSATGGAPTTQVGGSSSTANGGSSNPMGGDTGNGVGGSSNVGTTAPSGPAAFPFPQNRKLPFCSLPTVYDNAKVRAAYEAWKQATVTSDGASGFLRVKKPDSGSVIGSTVSEGIGYGMILAVYFDDQALFDGLWKYEQLYLDAQGLMNWEIGPDGKVTSGGSGAATDGDEDMAFALVMADKQWGGSGTLDDTYLNHAKRLIELILKYEVDGTRNSLLKPGDQWGNVDVTNPSYFAPAYFRVFGRATGKVEEWDRVIAANYDILERSLNATSGNADNGLVPAWCDSTGKPVVAYSGAPTHFQNDSTRTPFRIGQDYCYFGEPRAKAYLQKINQFYDGVGVENIVDGYALNGTPKPERAVNGLHAASFVGPAGVAAMSDPAQQDFLDRAYGLVESQKLTAGTIYYQKSWTALSLLMMTGNLVDFTDSQQ